MGLFGSPFNRTIMILSKSKAKAILNRHSQRGQLPPQEIKREYITSFILLICVSPALILLLMVMPFSLSEIVRFSPALILVAVLVFFLYSLGYRVHKSDRANKDLAFLENHMELRVKKYIVAKLGKQFYFHLNPEFNAMNTSQIKLCTDLLNQKEVKSDKRLVFYIYWILARFYLIDENPAEAIASLKEAILIDPRNIIMRTCMAETYECMGNGDKAVQAYESLKSSCLLSAKLTAYVNDQIRRINRDGPRREPAVKGLRYITH